MRKNMNPNNISQPKDMKRILLMLTLPLLAAIAMAQEDEWHPVAEWPFIYQDFQKAYIYVGEANKKVTAKSNIHIKQGRLWFISGKDNKTKLQAKPGTINKVIFANGITFIPIEDRLCEVVRQDTIDGKICAVYHDMGIDMVRYNEMVNSNMGSIADGIEIAGMDFTDYTTRIAANNSADIIDQQPLPTTDRFYINYKGDTFEVTEGNILKHLNKDERTAYRAYERKAEVITSNIFCVMDVYMTFFLK